MNSGSPSTTEQVVRMAGFALATLAVTSLLTYVWRHVPPPSTAPVAPAPLALAFQPMATGLERPVFVAVVPDGSGRLLVAEQAGALRVVADGEVASRPLLDLRDAVQSTGSEQGLLSFAFHPRFEQNGRMFVAYTAVPDGRLVVAAYLVSQEADGLHAQQDGTVLEVEKPRSPEGEPFTVHNGGQLRFGPRDGYLYVGLGDGTEPKYTDLTAQDRSSLWGSILRIDVDAGAPYAVPPTNPFVATPGARPEIFAFGLRNPWRFAFDPDGRTIWVSDVGQDSYEEIDRVVAGKNYGWPHREGTFVAPKANLHAAGFYRDADGLPRFTPASAIDYLRTMGRHFEPPVVTYGHLRLDPNGGHAAVGGFVYQATGIPELRGRYLFGDFVTGRFWSIDARVGSAVDWQRYDLPSLTISAIEPDAEGEPIVADYVSGTLYRLVPGEADGD